jgi:hypothetical protein
MRAGIDLEDKELVQGSRSVPGSLETKPDAMPSVVAP